MTDRERLATTEFMETRRLVFDQILWQMPGISFAGQAFLLTITLAPETSPLGRLFAAIFGTIVSAAVFQTFIKHRYTEEVYAEWVNARERASTGRGLTPGDIRDELAGHDHADLSWERSSLRWFIGKSSFRVWLAVFGAFAVGGVVISVVAAAEVVGVWAPLAG